MVVRSPPYPCLASLYLPILKRSAAIRPALSVVLISNHTPHLPPLPPSPPSLPPLQDEPDDFHHNGSTSTTHDPSSSPSSSSSSSFPPPATSDFAAAAATVAKGFAGTLRLVQRLQRLVTRKGMHNDPTAEIEDVTAVFKKDLGRLQGDIESLLRYAEKHYR